MNVARHHTEWLSLVEASGPFLSLLALLRVFPQGLDRRDPDRAASLREGYEEWLERGATVPAVHHAWIRAVLRDLLEYSDDLLAEGQAIPPGLEAAMATFGETLRPDLVLKHRDTDKNPVLLIGLYPPGQDLEKPVAGKLWKATAGTRMMELLHAADVPLGLVTNGEQWMLVSARRGETTGFASWYADLWMQEPLTLRAFHSLMHLRRFIGVAEADTLPALFVESSKDQQEVTDQLGYQVRQAVEVLIQAFDRVDAESGRALLAGMSEKTLYDSALTVMMRLVFLFSAEERGLLLLGDPLYDQNYAVSTLSELLRERADQHGEEVLERRHDAWCRLLSTFRAVHGGVEHEAMRLPAYGGSLFDPDRFAFLEGRVEGTSWQEIPAQPLLINNRVVLHLLEALQLLRVRVPGGGPSEARRLSFRALDIEQIGHVYEGLLDHTAKRAREPILGLDGAKDKRPEIPLETLEESSRNGTPALVQFLREATGRSDKTLKRLVQEPPAADEHSLLIACGQDERLALRIRPFAALLREDSFDRLVVIPPGSVYVTSGSDRRSTGTHYTPRSLTEPIVKHTLEPLVYVGPVEGLPDTEWTLKNPKEILGLKVCDMAMGSGAFLVEACRYLAERLVEAWENAEREHPGSFIISPDGELSVGAPTERLIPAEPAERLAIARRYVADRCLFGVDINPMAVEMAKLSLWLITLQHDRPFSFIDHAFKCGDSLLGVSTVKQIEDFSFREGTRQITFATAGLMRHITQASAKRLTLEALPSTHYAQIAIKSDLHVEAEQSIAKAKTVADMLVVFELRGLDGNTYENERTIAAAQAEATLQQLTEAATGLPSEALHGRHPFHWPLEFPEVFGREGFDAFVGNPPFIGGTLISGRIGKELQSFISRHYGSRVTTGGRADLCAYFLLRANQLLRPGGSFGLIATNTVSEGDTRELGLEQLVSTGTTIFRAHSSVRWPGEASLEVAEIWCRKGPWGGRRQLDDKEARSISTFLSDSTDIITVPKRLKANTGIGCEGSKPLGMGFVLSPADADLLLREDPRLSQVIFPFLNGEDINSRHDQSPSRWVINFHDWPLDKASAPEGYAGPVAADFQACLSIVVERVMPERTRRKATGEFVLRSPLPQRWWQHAEKRTALYAALSQLSRFLVVARVSKHLAFTFVQPGIVVSEAAVAIANARRGLFAVLQSSLHAVWVKEFQSSLETRGRYTPTDCLDTFPFPVLGQRLDDVGESYHEWRRRVMLERQEGLTTTYNRVHESAEMSDDIARLRALRVEMDQAVVAAYGWDELDLGHGFYETRHGVRYTLSDSASRTVLERLLGLNQQRYAEEEKAGLHAKGTKRQGKPKAKRADGSASSLFG